MKPSLFLPVGARDMDTADSMLFHICADGSREGGPPYSVSEEAYDAALGVTFECVWSFLSVLLLLADCASHCALHAACTGRSIRATRTRWPRSESMAGIRCSCTVAGRSACLARRYDCWFFQCMPTCEVLTGVSMRGGVLDASSMSRFDSDGGGPICLLWRVHSRLVTRVGPPASSLSHGCCNSVQQVAGLEPHSVA